MKEKKAKRIHIVLIVLILLLGAGILYELFTEGIGWFKAEIGEKPRQRGYVVIPRFESDIDLTETSDEYIISCDLPEMGDENNIMAEYNKEILTIRIPKRKSAEGVKPHKVQII